MSNAICISVRPATPASAYRTRSRAKPRAARQLSPLLTDQRDRIMLLISAGNIHIAGVHQANVVETVPDEVEPKVQLAVRNIARAGEKDFITLFNSYSPDDAHAAYAIEGKRRRIGWR